ncbi:MAG: DUF4252 domain-containing protein [Acidobacteriota bacterium]|nr:DUF4252 domain-containing protein [Acidobacteriota bacterium]
MRNDLNRWSRLAALAILTLLVATPLTLGADEDIRSHPGFIDGSFLAEYADKDGEFVEVTLDAPLLETLSAPAAAYDEDVAVLASKLKSVRALVINLRDGVAEEVRGHLADIRRTLERDGWQKIVEVRDGDENVNVLLKSGDDVIHGITVLVTDGNEMVFANVAGDLHMDEIQRVMSKWKIPGLEEIAELEPAEEG